MRSAKKKFFVLAVDLERFTLPLELGSDISRDNQYLVTIQGAEKLSKLLKRWGINATFFITKDIAVGYPEVVKDIARQGHEISLHYKKVAGSQKEIGNHKNILEEISGQRVLGFRSHKLEYFSSGILQAEGFFYDNSLHPTFVPGRYCNVFKPTTAYREKGLWKIPVSVTPWLRMPFSWVWFRNLGINYAKFCTTRVYANRNLINIYFHPWDFEDISKYNHPWSMKLICRNCGNKLLVYFNEYIRWLKEKDVTFSTFKDYIKLNKYE